MRGIKYYLSKIFLRPLRSALVRIMGVPKWHIASPSNKPYLNDIVLHLNSLDLERVAEIGCGTCDILRKINCNYRFGFDIDNRVLRVAKILNSLAFKEVSLSTYDFSSDDVLWDFDAILLINWPHEIPGNILKNKLDAMTDKMKVGSRIIIDTVGDHGYKFNHNINDLFNEDSFEIDVISTYGSRTVYAVVLR